MRWISWILATLLLVGWVATELPPVIDPAALVEPDLWRRTRDGWERAEWLRPVQPPAPLWLHPVVLATFQITVSVAGLYVLSQHRGPQPMANRVSTSLDVHADRPHFPPGKPSRSTISSPAAETWN